MTRDNIVYLKPKREHHPRVGVRLVETDRVRGLRTRPSCKSEGVAELERISTVGELCVALVAHLDASEPRVPVQPFVAATKRDLLRDLRKRKWIRSPPAYFTEILPNIYWTDAPPDAERCGLALLMCIGSMSAAMHHHGQYRLPVSQVARILRYFYEDRGLQFTRRRQRWWIRSTPEYEEQFGTVVRVRLPCPPQEDPLDLKDSLPNPSAQWIRL